jgi:hypothetical protein
VAAFVHNFEKLCLIKQLSLVAVQLHRLLLQMLCSRRVNHCTPEEGGLRMWLRRDHLLEANWLRDVVIQDHLHRLRWDEELDRLLELERPVSEIELWFEEKETAKAKLNAAKLNAQEKLNAQDKLNAKAKSKAKAKLNAKAKLDAQDNNRNTILLLELDVQVHMAKLVLDFELMDAEFGIRKVSISKMTNRN